ncbi:MAG TPA: type VI secretion system tip protein TssI/VgrG [Archangium sp.]|uniref:type VI secretion system Vgr family protein n=1 Tax=Archangium sp. TaxID=1872627 RepID=UPI002E328B3A|nr:type VI secretion system tip protein TssI/VgrG [Archangium sp.]HEX5748765.1 type VI secretion system tip protein TssI/VgrG [Archangium sp.]
MAWTDKMAFGLQVGGLAPEDGVVTQLSGVEGLSRPFEFNLDLYTHAEEPLALAELMGKPATLTFQHAGEPVRYVNGQVHRAQALGLQGGRLRYRLRVVPALERLKHVRRSRIFQHKAVPDIVKQVLNEGQVEHRLVLSGSYAPREYCVQYRESDFDFISRLLEEEGIFYFFTHSEDAHELLLGDSSGAYLEMAGGSLLPFREEDGRVSDAEHASALAQVHRLRPGKVMLRDFDFKKPALDLSARPSKTGDFDALELYDFPASYVEPSEGKRLGKVRLEEQLQSERTQSGISVSPRLCPGHFFELDAVAGGKLLVVEIQHVGHQPEVHSRHEALGQGRYRNEFRCMPSDVPFRPRRSTPRPVISGIQTATVTGIPGEEIHPDEHGRIKVQFHWDREGGKDDKSSCWIRPGQVWGGPAWGGLFLPRVGQEVVIRFFEGDPDRPLITGAVYNGQNPTPYSLPDEKTRSTLRTSSSPNSDGFNELRFEDAAGEEQVFFHAQKDDDLHTRNDKTQEIRANEALLVKKDRQRTIEGNQTLSVLQEDTGLVEASQTLKVTGNRTTGIRGSHDEEVEGNQSVAVSGMQNVFVVQTADTSVSLAAALNVGAAYSINVALMKSESVEGDKSIQVGGASFEYVAGVRQESVAEDRSTKVGSDFESQVKGSASLAAGKDQKDDVGAKAHTEVGKAAASMAKAFQFKADKFSLIVGGNLIVSMEKSGAVKWFAKSLTIDGSNIKVKGGKVKMLGAGSLSSKSVSKLELPDVQPVEHKDPPDIDLSSAQSELQSLSAQPLASSPGRTKASDSSK